MRRLTAAGAVFTILAMGAVCLAASTGSAPSPSTDSPQATNPPVPEPERPPHPRSVSVSGERGSPRQPRVRGLIPGPGIFRDVTERDIREIFAFTGRFLPRLHEELERMREEEPKRFRAICRKLRFRFQQLRALKKRDEKAFEAAIAEERLRLRARYLAAHARAATDKKELDRLKNVLREVIGKLLDAELVTREAESRRLEERLKELRRQREEIAARRKEIIEKRLEHMLKPRSRRPPASPPPEAAPEAAAPAKKPPPAPPAEPTE